MQPKPTIVKAPKGCDKYFTEGKNYKVIEAGNEYTDTYGWGFYILDDNGWKTYCVTKGCQFANGDWEIVGWISKFVLINSIKILKLADPNSPLRQQGLLEAKEYELQCLEQYLSENQSTTYTNVVHSELEQKAITGFNKDKLFKITE